MKNDKESKGVAATGIIAALAASSCCIPPIIAAIAGVGGAAGSLSWMEPLRPYLIGLAVVAIGYAWYNYLKPKSVDSCGCDIEQPKWYQTKAFLIGMTIFAAVSIGFPYFSNALYPDNRKNNLITENSEIIKIEVEIEGMTCVACQSHVNHAVNELNGILGINTSYDNKNALIEFDNSITTIEKIKKAVNSTGYTVTKIKEK